MVRIPDCLDPTNRSCSGNSYIKLSMSENRSAKIKSNIFHRLALRLVDGHGKGQTDRILTATEFKGKLGICRTESDARDENMLSSMISSKQPDLQHSVGHARDDDASATLQTPCPGFKLRKTITGQPTLSVSSERGRPEALMPLRNSTGYKIVSISSPPGPMESAL